MKQSPGNRTQSLTNNPRIQCAWCVTDGLDRQSRQGLFQLKRKEKDVVEEKPKSKVDLRQRLDYSKRLGDYVVKNIYEKKQDYTFKKKGVEGCHTQASGVLWWLGAPKA
ncbi:uncharacterized protein LOC144886344 [Branchiostoma floridae x Branchiostoma japonicum]